MRTDIVLGLTAPEDDGQTPLDPDEAAGLLPDWIATRGDLNVAEEDNIREGLAWARRALGRNAVLSQDFLRKLHKRMFGDVWAWAGKYRTSERNIGVAPHSIAVELKKLLDDAEAWETYGTYSIDERAARIHHRLTAIHPFPNGNGRCARIFVELYLEKLGHEPFTWGSESGHSREQQRQRYIHALREADKGDYGPLLGLVRS
jgi:Fic-DOC domain mobile mystery protein B